MINISESTVLTPQRVPWIWFLCPVIAGYFAANSFSQSDSLPFLFGALTCILVALLTEGWNRRPLGLWQLFFMGAAFCLAIAHYLDVEGPRKPSPTWLTLPPRELVLEVEITRLFNQRKDSETTSGLGLVHRVPSVRHDLIGKRLYFRLDPSDSVPAPLRGDVVRAVGVLYPVNGNKDNSFVNHLLAKGIYYEFRRGQFLETAESAGIFRRFCQDANHNFEKYLREGAEPENETAAGIGVAMLLGKKAAIPPEQKERFILAGAMHLFAISGLHVAIVAGLIILLLRLIPGPRWMETTLSLTLLFLYVQITGGAPSAQRAFIMIVFWKASNIAGRRGGALPALVASAIFVLAVDPRQLWDKGFQLSYSVVASIILYGSPLGERLQSTLRPWPFLSKEELSLPRKLIVQVVHWFGGALGVSAAATFASAPLTVEAFGVFSPGGILLNVFLVLLAFGVLWLAVFSLPFGAFGFDFLHEIAWFIIRIMDFLVNFFVGIPGLFFRAGTPVPWASGVTVLAYLGVCMALARRLPTLPAFAFLAAPACPAFFIAFGANLSFGN